MIYLILTYLAQLLCDSASKGWTVPLVITKGTNVMLRSQNNNCVNRRKPVKWICRLPSPNQRAGMCIFRLSLLFL